MEGGARVYSHPSNEPVPASAVPACEGDGDDEAEKQGDDEGGDECRCGVLQITIHAWNRISVEFC